MSSRNSTSAVHDTLSGSPLGVAPATLSSPDFTVQSAGNQTLPVGATVQIFPGYTTGGGWGSTDNAVELTDLGPITVSSSNPLNIGPLGASNAGFVQFDVQVPSGTPSGTQTVTATLTGQSLGDVYSDSITFNLSW